MIIAVELAQGGLLTWARGLGPDENSRYKFELYRTVNLLFTALFAYAVWTLIRAALIALDAAKNEPSTLRRDEIIRIHSGWFRRRVLSLNAGELLIADTPGDPIREGDFQRAGGLASRYADPKLTRFNWHGWRRDDAERIRASVEAVGIIGPSRHWRKLRIESPNQRRTF